MFDDVHCEELQEVGSFANRTNFELRKMGRLGERHGSEEAWNVDMEGGTRERERYVYRLTGYCQLGSVCALT